MQLTINKSSQFNSYYNFLTVLDAIYILKTAVNYCQFLPGNI